MQIQLSIQERIALVEKGRVIKLPRSDMLAVKTREGTTSIFASKSIREPYS